MANGVLGIDVGGVIIGRGDDKNDTSFFSDSFLKTPAMDGAFEAIRKLTDDFGQSHVFIVSKCGEKVQKKTLQWLKHHDFFRTTGMREDHVKFCLERAGKAPICERYEVTHFIDDRLEVLGQLTTVANRYLFHGKPREVEQFVEHLSAVIRVESWDDVLKEVL